MGPLIHDAEEKDCLQERELTGTLKDWGIISCLNRVCCELFQTALIPRHFHMATGKPELHDSKTLDLKHMANLGDCKFSSSWTNKCVFIESSKRTVRQNYRCKIGREMKAVLLLAAYHV